MQIRFLPRFKRAYRKLSVDNRNCVDEALQIFVVSPSDPRLYNHVLAGQMKGIRSLSAGYDLRILYRMEKNGAAMAIIMMVGTHDEVY